MGYLLLTLALAGGLGKGFMGKGISKSVNSFNDCVVINLFRMIFCSVVGFAVMAAGGFSDSVAPDGYSLAICVLSAVSMTAFCVCWMFAYKTEAYMFLSVFTMVASVITCIMTAVATGESITLLQIAGMLIIGVAVVIMSGYNKLISGKLTPKGIVILIVGCLGSAIADFCQKLCRLNTAMEPGAFNFYTYALSAILLSVMLIFGLKGNKGKSAAIVSLHNIIGCAAIAVCLYINSFAKTLAAGYLTSAQIYPVLQGSNLICSALLARVLFKEKITAKSIAGMACAFVGLMIMNIK